MVQHKPKIFKILEILGASHTTTIHAQHVRYIHACISSFHSYLSPITHCVILTQQYDGTQEDSNEGPGAEARGAA